MYKLVRPIFFALNPETSHKFFINLGVALARSPLKHLFKPIYRAEDKSLETEVFGLKFKNPVGLAAGFDKDGVLSEFLPALSFGFTEIGTVTPLPQPGNPKPRLFRLRKDKAIINRMGFNNQGVRAMADRLKSQHNTIPIGVNIGKNKDTPIEDAWRDYEMAFDGLADYARYIAVNVSSPNTPNLRELQERGPLTELLNRLQRINKERAAPLPILLKIAPDLTDGQLDDIVAIAKETHISGIIGTNTTINHPGEKGGLSGEPLKQRALQVISYLYKKSNGTIPLIGVGGIASPEDAYTMIKSGASLIQLYTGLVYEGPGLAKRINKGLVQLMIMDGYTSISQAVGKNS